MSYYTSANVTFDPYSMTMSTGTSGSVLTTSASSPIWASTGTYTLAADPWKTNSVKITSKGVEMPDEGDITFGNISLRETLQTIESRLAILRPDTALEAEWEELKELGDAYRRLEAEIQAKIKTWELLKRVDE